MSLTTSLHSQPEKSARRVRFSLPEAKLTLTADHNSRYRTLHGTSRYVNGTLINVTHTTHCSTTQNSKQNGDKSIVKLNEIGKQPSKTELNGMFKSNLKNGNLPKDSQYKMSINLRPTSVATTKDTQLIKHTLPKTTASASTNKKKFSKMKTKSEKSFKTLPIIEKKFSSLEDLNDEVCSVKINDFKTNLNRYKSTEDVRDPNNFKVSKNQNGNIPKLPATTKIVIDCPDDNSGSSRTNNSNATNGNGRNQSENRNYLTVPSYYELEQDEQDQKQNSTQTTYSKPDNSSNSQTTASSTTENANNMEQFFDFLEKWKYNRKYCNRKIENIFRNSTVYSQISLQQDVVKKRLVSSMLRKL